jgi:parallel beta-helix repeat protein
MRDLKLWFVLFCFVACPVVASADTPALDCSKKSLAAAVAAASKNTAISFTGVCPGPIVVAIDGLTLSGVGTAVIDGGGTDAVSITGASRVSLIDFNVTNAATGITARDGSHISLSGVNSHDNSGTGIALQASSSATLSDVSVSNNGGAGLSADDGASITLQNSTIQANTGKDILLTFGARATILTTVFGTYVCDATVLVRGTGGITCPH